MMVFSNLKLISSDEDLHWNAFVLMVVAIVYGGEKIWPFVSVYPPLPFGLIYVKSRSKTCLGTSKGHFLAIYTYISHYLPLYEKSNFCKNRDFSEF